MTAVDLDALARSFGFGTDEALAEELLGIYARTEDVAEHILRLGHSGEDVPGFAEAMASVAGWLDVAASCLDRALAACEEHERGGPR